MEQNDDRVEYEAPVLHELGDFGALTAASGHVANDFEGQNIL
jgi:hypothetical protein